MEAVSFIVLILLSLVGYSAGAVFKAGKFVELKPQVIDLILILVIWSCAIYSRLALPLNKWLLILIWVIAGAIVGILSVFPRKLSRDKALSNEEPEITSKKLMKKLWKTWENFSKRMGSFQSRILLSLFFFFFVFRKVLLRLFGRNRLTEFFLERGYYGAPLTEEEFLGITNKYIKNFLKVVLIN
jgi:hypothetical protein